MSGRRVGDVLASKYRLEELLGSGGMGHVYRAMNVRAGRAVAIKILRTEHATNTPIVDRFLREALAANLVRHPNVVDVLDVDKDDDGAPFIVQELLMGEDLAHYVERRGGRLNLEEIEMYLVPVIDAVAEAHAKGVVHRDIKPENVFLATPQSGTGRKIPKLLDFGISKVRLPDIKATEVGVMMGTPAYMAPEQIQGSRDADPRTDVWALGIMLFELLAGRLPFDAVDAPALFVAIATTDAGKLSELHPEIDPNVSRVVERCLRRLPDQRYPSALELARDMRHVLEGADIEPTQTRSLPPGALRGAAAAPGLTLNIPDLALPKIKETDAFELQRKPAAATMREDPAHFAKTELGLSNKGGTAALEVPDLPPAPKPPPSNRGMTAPHVTPPASVPNIAPASRPAPVPPSSSRVAHDQAMPGVMFAGSSTSTQRRTPWQPGQHHPQPKLEDYSFIVGLAVIGLVALGTTAVLTGVAAKPEGISLLSFVMKPVPSTPNLVVQGAFGIGGLVLAGKAASGGVKRWRGDLPGGHGAAVFFAIIAGAVLFAAVQLGRAAW